MHNLHSDFEHDEAPSPTENLCEANMNHIHSKATI